MRRSVQADAARRVSGLAPVSNDAVRRTPHTARQAWVLAIRPRTLTAAIVPVVVGSGLAWGDGLFHGPPALAALAAALLIQIGTNLFNDADDFERGADTTERRGPLRVTQSGLLSARQVRRGALLAFAGAAAFGSYLVVHAGWPILVLGLLALLSGWGYTGGPRPFGYAGLGELFVFVFFGIAAVAGTYYVQALRLSTEVWLCSLPVACLATAILVVNNTRDRITDAMAGKRTLAVRFGERFGRIEFICLLVAGYLLPVLSWATGASGVTALLPWVTAPSGAALVRTMAICTDGERFNEALGEMARLHLRFGILFAFGLAL